MRLAELRTASFIENADHVDDGIASAKVANQRGTVVNVRAMNRDAWQDPEFAVLFTIAREHAHAMSLRGQPRNKAATDEARAAQQQQVQPPRSISWLGVHGLISGFPWEVG